MEKFVLKNKKNEYFYCSWDDGFPYDFNWGKSLYNASILYKNSIDILKEFFSEEEFKEITIQKVKIMIEEIN